MAAKLPPIGHVWWGEDNQVIAIDPAMAQVQPGTDVDALRCVGCDAEPFQRCNTSGELLFLLAFHDRSCQRLKALYADPRTVLFDPYAPPTETPGGAP